MEKENSKLLFTFIAGAAVGAAIGYFLASDNKEEIIDELKNKAGKLKDDLSETLKRGKQVAEDLSATAEEVLGV